MKTFVAQPDPLLELADIGAGRYWSWQILDLAQDARTGHQDTIIGQDTRTRDRTLILYHTNPIPDNTMHHYTMPCNTMYRYTMPCNTIPCNISVLVYTIPCNILIYPDIPANYLLAGTKVAEPIPLLDVPLHDIKEAFNCKNSPLKYPSTLS